MFKASAQHVHLHMGLHDKLPPDMDISRFFGHKLRR